MTATVGVVCLLTLESALKYTYADYTNDNVIKDETSEEVTADPDNLWLMKLIVCSAVGSFTLIMMAIAYYIWKTNPRKTDENPDIEMVNMADPGTLNGNIIGNEANLESVAVNKYVKMKEEGGSHKIQMEEECDGSDKDTDTQEHGVGLSEQPDDIKLPPYVNAILEKYLNKHDKYTKQGRKREAKEQMQTYRKWRTIAISNAQLEALLSKSKVERDCVQIEKRCGFSKYSNIFTATWTRKNKLKTVIVKYLNLNASMKRRHFFVREIAIMDRLKPHPNVVKFYGHCLEREPLYQVLEYATHDILYNFLKLIDSKIAKEQFGDLFIGAGPKINLDAKRLKMLQITFARDIANGMAYLASEQIIHRDLESECILVNDKFACKVSDFYYAIDCKESDGIQDFRTYIDHFIPLRWQAYECLKHKVYTTKSDVWSYGVLLWEIFTLGDVPYADFDGEALTDAVLDGYKLEKPENCREKIYRVMESCWHNEPGQRPSFDELQRTFDNMLHVGPVYGC